MYIQNTGKALALSVFLHTLVLYFWLMAIDTSKQIELRKTANDSTEKGTLSVTYITVNPAQVNINKISSPTPNLVSKKNSVDSINLAPKITDSSKHIEPTNSLDTKLQPLQALKYYTSEEVLEPAKPLGDWVLDFQALPNGRTFQIFLEIWVLENGELEKFELIDASINDDFARLATRNLLQTPMSPAMQDGKPVASVRKLAILIDTDE